jgi:hypothetical protein
MVSVQCVRRGSASFSSADPWRLLGPFEKTVLQGIARKNECPELCASVFRTHGVVYDPFRRAENPDMLD